MSAPPHSKLEAHELLEFNVAKILFDYGWTQRDLADELQVHPGNLSRTLRGVHSPRLTYLEQIADVLDVDIADLFAPL